MSESKTYPKELLKVRDLGKWPHVLVWGKSVTPEQAEEVILRTHCFPFSTNAHDARDIFEKKMGIAGDAYGRDWRARWESEQVAARKIRSLYGHGIEYLYNANVMSSYAWGPGGWIHWEGTVGSQGKNIGKWPQIEEVYDEWVLIAKTFPYLDLTCHLHPDEGVDGLDNPLVEFRIQGGHVLVTASPGDSALHVDLDSVWSFDRDGRCVCDNYSRGLDSAEVGLDFASFERIWDRLVAKFAAEDCAS